MNEPCVCFCRRGEGQEWEGSRDRGRGRGGWWQGRGRGRDHSYDASRGRRGHGERGGGARGFGRGGEGVGRGGYRGTNRGGRPRHFPVRQIAGIEDFDDITMRLISQLEEFEAFMSLDSMSTEDAMNTLKILSRVVQCDLQRESVLKVLQVVCTSRFLDAHLVSLIQSLPSCLEFGSQNRVTEAIEFIHQLLTQVCLKLPSYGSRAYLLLAVLNNTHDIVELLERRKPRLAEDLKGLAEECQQCMKRLQDTAQKTENRARFNRGPNDDDDSPPDDFSQLPVFPSARDMDSTERIFLR